MVTYLDMCEEEPLEYKAAFEKPMSAIEELKLTAHQKMLRDHGYVELKGLLPEKIIERYTSLRDKLENPGGWRMPCPYLHFNEIKDICLYRPLSQILFDIFGWPMGLHLNLTGYVSTERDWHQDGYLNPSHVGGYYIEVWMALDDIHPDSGPFQYYPGSHKWPVMSQKKVWEIMSKEGVKPTDPKWPSLTQGWVAETCEREAARRGVQPISWCPKKGDVLLWSRTLVHRGSRPNVQGMQRKALISHYSSIGHRKDMPKIVHYQNQEFNAEGFYFDTGVPLEGPDRV